MYGAPQYPNYGQQLPQQYPVAFQDPYSQYPQYGAQQQFPVAQYNQYAQYPQYPPQYPQYGAPTYSSGYYGAQANIPDAPAAPVMPRIRPLREADFYNSKANHRFFLLTEKGAATRKAKTAKKAKKAAPRKRDADE
eukprot:NODE_9643_length_574_cov_37.685144_g9006_i0.p1 GENE.NODE_9643_length_574_cov_37.685144_g9006_i0~~NODE_9643_length_574_cov_37.685144_g9006_i0.p1  ORF type:complete len:136 (-),score=33.73 NODE_9643_length_574_cov_37.685144_g9006_i0:109-516(-)